MVKRIFLLILAFMVVLTAGNGMAELKLKDKTPAQQILKSYIGHVNEFLYANGEEQINTVFDQRGGTIAELGITMSDDPDSSYMPESVTVTVYMHYDSLHYLVLRVDNAERFPRIAASFLQALNPKTMTLAEAMKTPTERASKAINNPYSAFDDFKIDKYADKETEIMNAEKPQTYYAYYPDQYGDRVNWMQLTIVFPIPEYWDVEEGFIVTEEEEEDKPYIDEMQPDGYEGYFADDQYEHFQKYVTPTPEPDSAAGEDSWY